MKEPHVRYWRDARNQILRRADDLQMEICLVSGGIEKLDIGLPIVRVSFVDTLGGPPEIQYWAAACAKPQALEAVRQHMPLNATVEMAGVVLTQERIRQLGMRPGSIQEVTDVGLDPKLDDE